MISFVYDFCTPIFRNTLHFLCNYKDRASKRSVIDRNKQRQTNRQKDRQTIRYTYRQSDSQRGRQTHRHINKGALIEVSRDKQKLIETSRDTPRLTETNREYKLRATDIDKYIERPMYTETARRSQTN